VDSGSIGVGIVITAYAFLQAEKLRKESLLYAAMNMVGSVMIGISAWRSGAVSVVVLQCFWGIISVVAYVRHRIREKRGERVE